LLPLYRGTERGELIRTVRKDRRSKTKHELFFNYVDSELSKNFIAHRSNSILCTGDSKKAAEYGAVHLIFPIETFHFSHIVQDVKTILKNL